MYKTREYVDWDETAMTKNSQYPNEMRRMGSHWHQLGSHRDETGITLGSHRMRPRSLPNSGWDYLDPNYIPVGFPAKLSVGK